MNVTLEETLYNITSVISHFKVFCCEARALILDEKHKLMKCKSEKGTFVCYVEYLKSYSLFVPQSSSAIFW